MTDVRGTPIEAPRVFADGQSIAAAELHAPIILEAGPHLLRVEADGFNPIELERALRPTDRELEVAVTLQRVGETKPVTRARVSSPSHTVPVAAAVLAGTGVAALGASLFFGLRSHSQYEDLKTSCAPRCEPSRADSLRSNALISDVTLLGAVAALGAAVWFYFDAPRQPANTAMGVSSTPHGADLRLHVAF
ncbi:MAG TPA: hypothetical protein VNW92_18160 [Polyangiaceae bacterium]|nr:hypothetical protein [Polyangiaceae bacterium]